MDSRNRHLLFSGLVVNLEQMDVKIGSKGWHTFQIIRHPGGVAVLPLHDDGTVTLIRQLRPAIETLSLEIPAGRRDPGEDPAGCGLRELSEETGLTAGHLEPLGFIYPSPGVIDEVVHLYLATALHQESPMQEAYEDIETIRIPLVDAVARAEDGRINDAKTVIALMRAARRKP
jgi:ADP-ribose pyrophosphatase